MLDETLRHRLRALADSDDPALDPSSRERIVRAVGERGPEIVRRSGRNRVALLGGGVALAAAAAAALFVGTQRADAPMSSNEAKAPAAAPVEPRASGPVEQAARACEQRPERSAVEVGFRTVGDRAVLDLDTVAYAVAPSSSDVYLQEATRCRTIIALRSGRIAVHARDLGGGELVVKSGDAEVAVRGTVFSVTRENGDLAVEVAEGRVLVARAERDHKVEVDAGHRVAVSESDADVEPQKLDSSQASALLEEVVPDDSAAATGDGAAQPTKAGSDDDLLRRAEALRNAGDLAGARRLYRRVGSGSGPSAEAAWLALARMELAAGNSEAARAATKQRDRRFGGGALGPEALWIQVRTHRQAGNDAAARRAARRLVKRWPQSAQAAAARRWLASEE